MLDSKSIVRLYKNAMFDDMRRYEVVPEAVRIGIESMAHIYKPDIVGLNAGRSVVADFNDVAHRCAYLHKYAAFHTAMVRDMMSEAIQSNYDFFCKWVFSENNFKICSLGGGPGSDIIGSLAALYAAFSSFPASAVVVDYMFEWSYSFDSVLRELGSGCYGLFGNNVSRYLNWRYVEANLLKSLLPNVLDSLASASLVTMIKFASAAACQDTETMITNIFAAMKPGALVLFIDNDGGGFHDVFVNAAAKFNFVSIFGPFRHMNYANELVRIKEFGFVSCFKSTVTVHILQKPLQSYPIVLYNSPRIGNPNRRVILESPALLPSPPTPLLFCPFDFTRDEDLHHNDFRSPLQELPQSPCDFALPSDVTPAGSGKRKRRRITKPSCLPLYHIRRNLARKVHQIKSRACSLVKRKKKNKVAHPIFRL